MIDTGSQKLSDRFQEAFDFIGMMLVCALVKCFLLGWVWCSEISHRLSSRSFLWEISKSVHLEVLSFSS